MSHHHISHSSQRAVIHTGRTAARGAHGGPWSAASTSLSCPHFSAFFEADLTPLLAGPAKGGQAAEQISHVSQALDHGLKLRRRFTNCCFQAWSRQSEWALLPHPVIRLKMI